MTTNAKEALRHNTIFTKKRRGSKGGRDVEDKIISIRQLGQHQSLLRAGRNPDSPDPEDAIAVFEIDGNDPG